MERSHVEFAKRKLENGTHPVIVAAELVRKTNDDVDFQHALQIKQKANESLQGKDITLVSDTEKVNNNTEDTDTKQEKPEDTAVETAGESNWGV